MPIIDRAPFVPYFRMLADRMGLKDWAIEVKLTEGPDNSEAFASVVCTEGRKRAVVRLSEDFLRETPEAQRNTACHELIHCHFAYAQHVAGKVLSDSEWRVWMLANEYGIDGAADAWSPLLPLPG